MSTQHNPDAKTKAPSRQWNSSLRRKTPLKRSGFKPAKPAIKRGSPLRQKSKKLAKRERDEYGPVRAKFLTEHPLCQICQARGLPPNLSTEVHHMRGRNGSLLSDVRFFCSSCRACRDFPNEHPAEARSIGVLASASEYGVSLLR